ncbi:tRNA/rRNA methyltransferase (SpoU) family protein [Abeliophyllum distichum]|uniref:tRNA/rRNA methyltransferase (SpoU) family protein n=1 Tax=Abeliophyllum distichum TaxID=126358 RepID=A0ABD1SDZ0_9LAMI
MLCFNTFLISATPLPLTNAQNSKTRIKTHKIKCIPEAYDDDDDETESASKNRVAVPHHLKTITSTSNLFVKHCLKLRRSSSYRHSHGSVLVVGTTPIREIYSFQETLQDRPTVECLLVLDKHDVPQDIDGRAIHVIHVSSAVMRKLSGVQSIDSVEVVALMRIPSTFHVVSNSLNDEDRCRLFPFPHRILILDGIQDPGNLGTLLRSATAFRWGGVFLLPGCCDPFNEKALRASRGASFQIPIVSGNWIHVESLRKEFQMKMLAGHPADNQNSNKVHRLSQDFADYVADLPLCLVLGSEGAGLSEESRRACELISIPMAGEFESLNVSVAGGIFMYMLQPENRRVN